MKSVLEIVTILIFLFCITMLERMNKACGYSLPAPYHQNTKHQKNSTQANLAALITGCKTASVKTVK